MHMGYRESTLLDLLPGAVRVVRLHGGSDIRRLLSHILLVDDPALVHDESHDAGIPVFRGIGNKGKAAGQLTANHVVARPTFGGGSLLGKDAVIITVEGRRVTLLKVVALGSGGRNQQRADRAGIFGL